MSATITAPAASSTTAVEAPGELDFEARLVLADAEMAGRCRMAVTALDVSSARPETTVDLSDVVTGPVAMPVTVPDLYPTPVAALLQRAHARLVGGGWCSGYAVDGQGAVCLQWAIHLEARGDTGLEIAGLNHLLDQIRRDLDPRAESVPSWNDQQPNSRMPLHILGTAADTAAQRGI